MWRTWRGDTSSSPLRATLAWLRLNIKVQFNLVNDILNVCCDGLLWRETLLAIWNVDRENGWVSGTVPLCWYCVAFFNVEKTFRLPRHRWVDQTLFHLSNRIGRAALLQLQQWTGGPWKGILSHFFVTLLSQGGTGCISLPYPLPFCVPRAEKLSDTLLISHVLAWWRRLKGSIY